MRSAIRISVCLNWRLAALAFGVVWTGAIEEPRAQDLFEMYQKRQMQERVQLRANERLTRRPLDHVQASSPLSFPNVDTTDTDPIPAASDPLVYRIQRIPKYGRNWFLDRYEDIEWTYTGSGAISSLDTMYTQEIRARLETQFGPPTQTLGDFGPLFLLDLDEYIQFEYWFVVNDTIPIVIMDVNGPFERGIVVASSDVNAEALISLRDSFLRQVVLDADKTPYADYYFEEELGQWFLAGYDGSRFFLLPVDARRTQPGRPYVGRSGIGEPNTSN